MRKKSRLKLEDLKVQSFVTSLDEEEKKTVKAGFLPSFGGTLCGYKTICDNTFIFRCKKADCVNIDLGEPPENDNPIRVFWEVRLNIGHVSRICDM